MTPEYDAFAQIVAAIAAATGKTIPVVALDPKDIKDGAAEAYIVEYRSEDAGMSGGTADRVELTGYVAFHLVRTAPPSVWVPLLRKLSNTLGKLQQLDPATWGTTPPDALVTRGACRPVLNPNAQGGPVLTVYGNFSIEIDVPIT